MSFGRQFNVPADPKARDFGALFGSEWSRCKGVRTNVHKPFEPECLAGSSSCEALHRGSKKADSAPSARNTGFRGDCHVWVPDKSSGNEHGIERAKRLDRGQALSVRPLSQTHARSSSHELPHAFFLV